MEDDYITAEAENDNNNTVIRSKSGSKRKDVEKNQEQEDEKRDQDQDGGGGGGGIIANIISNLVSPLSTPKGGESKKGKFDLFEDDDVDAGQQVKVNGQEGTGGVDEQVKADGKEVDDNGGDHGGGGGGGGLIGSIVSHIPTSLPDDAAPSPDEASLLIHAIVHD